MFDHHSKSIDPSSRTWVPDALVRAGARNHDGPPGLRPTTRVARETARLANDFNGLPAGITRWRLAAALRAAAQPLGLTMPMLRLLELYIDMTYDVDWTTGNEPVICRPLVEIADHLDRSERQIRNIEKTLATKGLLAWRDSGNHHRKGRRDHRTKQLIYGYGPSLAPLGSRCEEIIALANLTRETLAAQRRCRIAIGALRRRIRADLAALGNEAELHGRFTTIDVKPRARISLEALERHRQDLTELARDIDMHDGALTRPRIEETTKKAPKISPKPEIFTTATKDTNNRLSINGTYAREQQKNKSTQLSAIKEEPAKNDLKQTETISSDHHRASAPVIKPPIPLTMAHRAATTTMRETMVQHGSHGWSAMIDAAAEHALLCGIDKTTWAEACHLMGRRNAALSVIVLEHRLKLADDKQRVRSPVAYLRAMAQRAVHGELHLDRSIRKLLRENNSSMELASC
jgi:replication initiation protein RepC